MSFRAERGICCQIKKEPDSSADAKMPEMDGFALAQAIRNSSEFAASRVVMMLTSPGQQAESARCRELELTSYVTKPVSRAALATALLRALDPARQRFQTDRPT